MILGPRIPHTLPSSAPQHRARTCMRWLLLYPRQASIRSSSQCKVPGRRYRSQIVLAVGLWGSSGRAVLAKLAVLKGIPKEAFGFLCMIHDMCISLRQGCYLGLIARRFSRIVILIIEGGRRREGEAGRRLDVPRTPRLLRSKGGSCGKRWYDQWSEAGPKTNINATQSLRMYQYMLDSSIQDISPKLSSSHWIPSGP